MNNDEELFEEEQMRTEEDIIEYMEEACDKVWYMRSRPCDIPDIEKRRLEAIKKLKNNIQKLKKDLILGIVVFGMVC